MQKIPISLARAGMLLAEPVSKVSGLIIVGKGCELSETLLDKLKAMGIESLVVVSAQPAEQDAEQTTRSTRPTGQGSVQTAWSRRAARLDRLFRKHAGDAWMEEVKGSLRSYFLLRDAAEAKAIRRPEVVEEDAGQ